MRNILFLILLLSGLALASCDKGTPNDCPAEEIKANESEMAALEQYIKHNSVEADFDERGFYYKIDAPGTGANAKACSKVTVSYKGWLTNGTVFDEAKEVNFELSKLILGWRAGIPLLAKDGRITLYLPPSLGYGTRGSYQIPANSILIFSIELKAIN